MFATVSVAPGCDQRARKQQRWLWVSRTFRTCTSLQVSWSTARTARWTLNGFGSSKITHRSATYCSVLSEEIHAQRQELPLRPTHSLVALTTRMARETQPIACVHALHVSLLIHSLCSATAPLGAEKIAENRNVILTMILTMILTVIRSA